VYGGWGRHEPCEASLPDSVRPPPERRGAISVRLRAFGRGSFELLLQGLGGLDVLLHANVAPQGERALEILDGGRDVGERAAGGRALGRGVEALRLAEPTAADRLVQARLDRVRHVGLA